VSYNITGWKLEALRLALPLDFDFQSWLRSQPDRDEQGYENVGKRWCLEDGCAVLRDLAASTWKLSLSGKEIAGTIEGNKLVAAKLTGWTGDCSGILYSDILLPLFKEFNGTLVARVVWEGGDSIKQVHVHEGSIEETEL
jgi:hypothetical protein